MDWDSGRRSDNVEDQRGVGRPVAIGGGLTLVILLVGWLFGVDPSQLLQLLSQTGADNPGTATSTAPVKGTPQEERQKDFVSVVLASTEDTWPPLLAARGIAYVPPKLVLFRGPSSRPVGLPRAPRDLSTVRSTSGCSSTFPSSTS